MEEEITFDVDDVETLVGLRVERLDDHVRFTVVEASPHSITVEDEDENEVTFTAAEQGGEWRFLI